MTNEPEEYRKIELEAQSISAQVATDMLKRPRSRWILRPIYRVFKWVERKCDEALKQEGWR